MKIKSNLWFESDEKAFFGKGRIELLEQIERHGSISKAAKAMKMSYKAAWDAVNEMNSLSREPIVAKETGGRGGGGTRLTEKGQEYIRIYKEISSLQKRLFDLVSEQAVESDRLRSLSRRLTLQTSARNQYLGRVVRVECREVECEVELDIGDGELIRALITSVSAEKMGIETGMEIFALIKSSWVKPALKAPEKSGANMLAARVESIVEDGEFTEIGLVLRNGTRVVSVVKRGEAEAAGLEKGSAAYALFSPSDVILAR